MANTFTQLHVQFVFAVQHRISLIHPSWEEEMNKYITGIVENNKHKMLAINGMPDHTHFFVGLHPTQSISSLMQVVKGESSECPPACRAGINKKGFVKGKFQWQEGYGAFSYSKSQVNQVYKYIMNQKEYHKKRSFLDEYREFLKKNLIFPLMKNIVAMLSNDKNIPSLTGRYWPFGILLQTYSPDGAIFLHSLLSRPVSGAV